MNPRIYFIAVVLLGSLMPGAIHAQATESSPVNAAAEPAVTKGAYVYISRTPAHVRISSSTVFEQVRDAIVADLDAQHVAVLKVEDDDPAYVLATENVKVLHSDIMSDVLVRARAAGASHVLVFLVDRPAMHWVGVKMECVDLSGQSLWQDTVTSASSTWTSGGGLRQVVREMQKQLAARMGQPGMAVQGAATVPAPAPIPAATASTESSAAMSGAAASTPSHFAAESPHPDESVLFPANLGMPAVEASAATPLAGTGEPATVGLAAGTPVRLMLKSTVNGATSKVGDVVQFSVLEDVKDASLVVIARGADASGVITGIQPPRRRNRPGSITVRVKNVALVTGELADLHGERTIQSGNVNASARVDDQMRALSGVEGGVLVIPFLALEHGEAAVLPAGMEFPSMLERSVTLDREDAWLWQPVPEEKRQGDAVVTVHNISILPGPPLKLYCGKAELAKLVGRTSYQFSLPPGKYWFRTDDKKRWLPVTLEEGGQYYLRLDSEAVPDAASGNAPSVLLQDAAIGETELANTVPLDPKYIKDISKIDPGLLSAVPE
jgi:hypothetical protein